MCKRNSPDKNEASNRCERETPQMKRIKKEKKKRRKEKKATMGCVTENHKRNQSKHGMCKRNSPNKNKDSTGCVRETPQKKKEKEKKKKKEKSKPAGDV